MLGIRAVYLRVIGKLSGFPFFGIGDFQHRVHFTSLKSSSKTSAVWPGDLEHLHLIISWESWVQDTILRYILQVQICILGLDLKISAGMLPASWLSNYVLQTDVRASHLNFSKKRH